MNPLRTFLRPPTVRPGLAAPVTIDPLRTFLRPPTVRPGLAAPVTIDPLRTFLRPPTVRPGLAAVVAVVIAALLATACATVPVTGRHQLLLLSEGQETQMGLTAYQQILKKSKLSTDPVATEQVTALLGAGATVGLLLPWSRTQESEADHLGLILMAKAGYDPHAALDLWRRMAEAAKGSGRPPEFLSTHPSEATRIVQIEG